MRLGALAGTCADVAGISALALSAILAVSTFVAYRPTKVAIGRVVPYIFLVIALFFALGTFI